MALGDFRIPAPLLWQSLVFCALLAAAIVLARLRSSPRDSAGRAAALLPGPRCCSPPLVAVVPRPVDHPRDALLMEAIDVGQGDSLLLITPDGKTLLVDGGGHGGGPHQAPQDYDIGEEVVSEVLWSRGIRRLDAVALTHAHSDHMGGLPAVLRNFHPAELWVGNNPRFGAYNALLDEAAGLHVRVRSLRAGDAFSFGPTQVNVLAPFRDYQPGAEPTNNDSLVMRVAYGATSVMLEGDAEAPVEAGHAGRAGPGQHTAQGGPSRQHHLHAARVPGPRASAVGRHLLRPAQPLRPSPHGGAGRARSGQDRHLLDRHQRRHLLPPRRQDNHPGLCLRLASWALKTGEDSLHGNWPKPAEPPPFNLTRSIPSSRWPRNWHIIPARKAFGCRVPESGACNSGGSHVEAVALCFSGRVVWNYRLVRLGAHAAGGRAGPRSRPEESGQAYPPVAGPRQGDLCGGCALCHGDNGDGKTDVAKEMGLTLGDWTDPKTLAGKPDQELFNIIRNGKGKMPAEAEGRAKDHEVWNLILYIRGFAKAQPAAPQSPAAAPQPAAAPAPNH